ncbi:PTS sugar transporter subunit IIA, partial [Phocaeicola sp.]|uniref:PTS sugar transporter subunit IIA n=1 Tax=Phocaeicola sp. TaxID=2773926 RepID=UPI003AB7666F
EFGITDSKEGLKDAFLKREEEYTTGLQDGFAIPHAKTEYAKETAVFFVKCKNQLDWGTLDDTKVNYAFALIVPKEAAGNEHLMMISQLATNLLEDEFRDEVKSATDIIYYETKKTNENVGTIGIVGCITNNFCMCGK